MIMKMQYQNNKKVIQMIAQHVNINVIVAVNVWKLQKYIIQTYIDLQAVTQHTSKNACVFFSTYNKDHK